MGAILDEADKSVELLDKIAGALLNPGFAIAMLLLVLCAAIVFLARQLKAARQECLKCQESLKSFYEMAIAEAVHREARIRQRTELSTTVEEVLKALRSGQKPPSGNYDS